MVQKGGIRGRTDGEDDELRRRESEGEDLRGEERSEFRKFQVVVATKAI